jgi:predicted nucleic acid-binding protein
LRIFCDTSVLVAGCVRLHPHFNRARPVLEAAYAKKGEYLISSHSLAEIYSVLTNLPLQPKILPTEARLILETNILPCFRRVAVTAKMYEKAVLCCAELGLKGGVVYDALLLECARAAEADRIYTFNTRDFQRLAPDLVARIAAP